MRLLALTLLLLVPLTSLAEEVVIGMSSDQVSINTNFDGSEILIFGAIKRDAPPPDGAPIEVIVTVSGPSEPIVVRRKEKRLGIWVNTDAVEVDLAPSFYAVATSTLQLLLAKRTSTWSRSRCSSSPNRASAPCFNQLMSRDRFNDAVKSGVARVTPKNPPSRRFSIWFGPTTKPA